jgi:hypothetical protein
VPDKLARALLPLKLLPVKVNSVLIPLKSQRYVPESEVCPYTPTALNASDTTNTVKTIFFIIPPKTINKAKQNSKEQVASPTSLALLFVIFKIKD